MSKTPKAKNYTLSLTEAQVDVLYKALQVYDGVSLAIDEDTKENAKKWKLIDKTRVMLEKLA
jgi:hypothetical protein